jgi:putative hydrolase of the HAD superfamily
MINTFIFDFDGLILDTELACYLTWVDIYKKYHAKLPLEEWIVCVGTTEEAFDPIKYLKQITKIESLDTNEILYLHNKEYRQRTSNLVIKPGVLDYLEWARKNQFNIAIASSSDKDWVISHLENLQIIQYFDVVRTNNDVEKVKPDPELYLSVKKYFQINDYEGVIFEDSLHGINAGLAANLFTVAVPNELTKNLELSAANLIITGLDTISPSKLLKTLENKLKLTL